MQILASVDWAVYTVAIAWGADSSLKFTTAAQAQETIKLGVIAIPIWGFSIGFIKLSVACLLPVSRPPVPGASSSTSSSSSSRS
jgi:hypothetical protein